MSAPDYDTLYKLEYYVEVACKSILEDNDIRCFRSQDEGIKKTPHVIVLYENEEITGHMSPNANNEFLYDSWNGSLTFLIMTNRRDNKGQHDVYRSKIRNLFLYFRQAFTTDNMPYHQFTSMLEQKTMIQIQEDKEIDVTPIGFKTILNIRSDAWPT